MSEKDQIFQKIDYVISSGEQFNEDQFLQVLEGLIERGGKEAEFLLVKYISDSDIHYETRIKVITASGTIRNVMYLLPLKKVIDSEPNIKLKKAAIMALAKFNSERAMHILTASLNTVGNPILLKTIKEKINLIRQSHPVLALMPRFLRGNKDIKAHQVSLGMLKKSLTPDDMVSFLTYKDHEDPLVRKSVFELLCFCGNEVLQDRVTELFMERADACECLGKDECGELRSLTQNLKHYLLRFPSLMDAQCGILRDLFSKTGDMEVKKVLIGIFCQCKGQDTIAYIKDLYDQEPDLRETIIEASAGNTQAVEFLFEKYESGKLLKEKVVKSLLHSDQGLHYFINHFSNFEPDQQEMIVKNLPYSDRPEVTTFMESTLKSGNPDLKKHILKIISQNFLYTFKSILFDPDLEDEFLNIETDYLFTLFNVFPSDATKKLMIKIAEGELGLGAIKRYLTYINKAAGNELCLYFNEQGDDKRILQMTKRVINMNNLELTKIFLSTMTDIKTFDFNTYRYFSDALNYFTKVKSEDDNIPEEEKALLRRVRDNFKEILEEVRKIEAIEKDIKLNLQKTVPDVLQFKRIIASNGIAVTFKAHTLTQMMVDYFKHADEGTIAKWRVFFKEFPLVTQMVRDARMTGQGTPPEPKNLLKERLRVVISFQEKDIAVLFRDQLHEILPTLKIAMDDTTLIPSDMFLCDSDTLKHYIKSKLLKTQRVFVLLKNREEHNVFKDLNPRSFLQPISVFRTMKLMLQELYLPRIGQ